VRLNVNTGLANHRFNWKEISLKHRATLYRALLTSNVGKTIITHPPVITIFIGGGNHSQSWVVYDIVLTPLHPNGRLAILWSQTLGKA